MPDLKICRVCLSKDGKMYNYNDYNLKLYYEEIMGKKQIIKRLPQYFCYTCATLLYKFHKFKQKCHTGQQIINRLLLKGSITSTTLMQLDREHKKLRLTLDIVTINKRVKTYKIIHTNKQHKNTEEKSPIDNFDTDYESSNDTNVVEQINLPEEIENDNINTLDVKGKSHSEINKNIDSIHYKKDTQIELSNDKKDKKVKSIKKRKCDASKVKIENNKFRPKTKLRTSTEENTFSDREPGFESSDDEDIIRLEQINIDEHKNIEIIDKIEDKEVKVDTKKKNEAEIIEKEGIQEVKKSQNDKKKEEVKPTSKRKRGPNKTKPKAAKSTKISMKIETNKFRPKTKHLNPEHWLKITLSEEEAMEKFKARATDRKYLSAAFQCNKCYKGFSTKDIYTRHMKLAHDESRGPLECRFCGIRFKHQHAIRRHMLVHYHRFQCLRCKLVFLLEGSAHIHNDVHSGVARVCERCGIKFRHLNTYYTHMRIYHRSEHVCTVCGVSFVSELGLKLHKRVKHLTDEIEPPAEGENTYCVRCDIKFETKQAYDEHFRESVKHADDDLALDCENDPDKSPENTLAFLKEKAKQLSRQGKRCATKCFVCEKDFESYCQYVKHHRAEHKDVPMRIQGFKICEICGASVKNGSIGQHMNRHTKSKVYPCSICGMKFYAKSTTTRHLLTHTGEKPFPCPLCEKRFTQKGSMQLHYRTFHLKEPYPERNKRKKKDQETPSFANLNYEDN